ncbi:Rpr2-domain-containing protein [Hypoxylon sp. FL1284]|nr:Rpr2-domain-containing protein [Hypoxylon sp. FL1284]
MAKSKEPGAIPNRPVYSRISYLYQAATYLANHSQQTDVTQNSDSQASETKVAVGSRQASRTNHADQALARSFVADLRGTSHKSQIRLSPAIKRSVCKYCDTFLVDGGTSSSVVENKSKGGKKPWADVLVVKCHTCQRVKRFPVQAPRQKRRPMREKTTDKPKNGIEDVDVSTNI